MPIYALWHITNAKEVSWNTHGIKALQWRHNKCDSVSNHRRPDCLFNRLFRRISKKISNLHVTGLCEGNPSVTGGLHSKRASYAKNVFIWWRHHYCNFCRCIGTRKTRGHRQPPYWLTYEYIAAWILAKHACHKINSLRPSGAFMRQQIKHHCFR